LLACAVACGPDGGGGLGLTAQGGDPDALFPIRQDLLAGLMDGTGEVVVEPRFYLLGDSSGELIPARAVRGEGEEPVPEAADEPLDMSGGTPEGFTPPRVTSTDGSGAAPAPTTPGGARSPRISREDAETVEGGLWGYVDRSGEWVIEPRFEAAGAFTDDLAVVRAPGGRKGYVDRRGDWVIEPGFDQLRPFAEGLAAVAKGGLWGFIDKAGETVVETRWAASHDFSEGLAAVQDATSDLWGFVDTSGELVIPARYSDALGFSEGLAVVRGSDGGFGFVDRSGEEVIPLDLFNARSFAGGLAAVKRGALWGFIDSSGQMVIEPRFREAKSFGSEEAGLAPVRMPGEGSELWGYADREGEVVVEPQFRSAEPFRGGLGAVGTADGWGYVDAGGAWVWEPSY
jgi:hypothetical protein